MKGFILPQENAQEAAIVSGIDVYGMSSLLEIIDFFEGKSTVEPLLINTRAIFEQQLRFPELDFADVKGQETMLEKRLPSILPPMSLGEALETTKIHSVLGRVKEKGLVHSRPFRAPHHTISDVALEGGGQYPQPGEISLAHNGVLFLDELPEFKCSVL